MRFLRLYSFLLKRRAGYLGVSSIRACARGASHEDSLELRPVGPDRRLIAAGVVLTAGFVGISVATGGVASVVCMAMAGVIFLTAMGSVLLKKRKDQAASRQQIIETYRRVLVTVDTPAQLKHLIDAIAKQAGYVKNTKEQVAYSELALEAAGKVYTMPPEEPQKPEVIFMAASFRVGVDTLVKWAGDSQDALRQHVEDEGYIREKVIGHFKTNTCFHEELADVVAATLRTTMRNGLTFEALRETLLEG